MSDAGGVGQIFNENKTAALGSAVSELILNNFGANSFSAPGLPTGLSITNGLLSGTFAACTFTLTASNTLTGVSVNKTLTYTASTQPPVITGIDPNKATFGSPANITIQINNGATAVTVSGLPAGLSHAEGSSLIITGTPSVAGSFPFNIKATNSAGSDTQTFTLKVLPGSAPVLTSATSVQANQNQTYPNTTNTNLHLYRFFTDLDGDPIRKPVSFSLPANVASNLNAIGMFLNPTNGVLFGTPTARTNLVLPVTISNAAIGSTTNFTLSILYAKPELAMPGNISTNEFVTGKPMKLPLIFSSQSVVSEIVGTNFAVQFPGLVLNTNQLNNATITGTPTVLKDAGTQITLKNADGTTDLTSSLTLKIVADRGQPSVNGEVEYVFSVGTRISVQLTADNGGANFAIVEGELPAGISLTSGGLLSGTPTTAGTFAPRIRASNNVGSGPGQLFRMVVSEDPPTIISSSVALGTISRSFSFALTAAPNPTAFQISSGTLPAGLSLAPDTGVISGTPTISGSFVLGVQARNTKGLGRASSLTLVISKLSPVITTQNLTTGNAEQPYSATVRADNEPDSFSASGLPAGLSISATGLISGTPAATFNGDVTVTASNSAGSDSRVFRLVINPTVVILTSTNLPGTVGTPLSFQLTANPSNDLVYAVGRQKLPSGLEITSTGLITGTPLKAESSAVTLRVVRRGQTTEDSRYTKVNFSLANPDFVAPNAVDGVLTFRAGQAGRSTISAPANFVITSVATDGVPEGLSWDGTALAGTPTTATRTDARSKISLTASLTTAFGTATLKSDFVVRVSGTAASLTLPEFVEVEVGKETRIPLTFAGTEVALSASGVPPGLSIINGTLRGTNTSTNGPAEWKALITADNAGFTGGTNVSQLLTIRLRNPVPVMIGSSRIITSAGRTAGLNFSFDGPVDQLRGRNLPPGVGLSGNRITVPSTLPAGKYTVQVESENRLRPGDSNSSLQTALADIRIFVDQGPPPAATLAAIPAQVRMSAGNSTAVTLIPADAGVRVSAIGLPAGVTLDPETGVLSGTPRARGTYRATVFVQNGKRWIKKTITLQVK